MTISSQNISDYLLQHKTVSLEKIGTIDLNNKEDKDIFEYDKRAVTSPDLLQYLSEIIGKPLPIVAQDTDFFLDQTRQLMNIRASNFVLNSIGYIYVNNSGEYAFSSDSSETLKEVDRKTLDDVYAKSPLTSSINYATRKNNNYLRIGSIALVLIAAIAFGAYYIHTKPSFFNDKSDSTEIQQSVVKPVVQNVITEKTLPQPVDKKGFKFVIQTFSDVLSCQKRQQQLKNYGNIVLRDTITIAGTPVYRLFVTDSLATASDTTHIKDSLRIYFGHPVNIE